MKCLILLLLLLIINLQSECLANDTPPDNAINCLIWSNYRIKTFEDQVLRFFSRCAYKILEFKTMHEDVSVIMDNGVQINRNNGTVRLNNLDYMRIISRKYTIPLINGAEENVDPGFVEMMEFPDLGMNITWNSYFVGVSILNDRNYNLRGLCAANVTELNMGFIYKWSLPAGCEPQRRIDKTKHQNAINDCYLIFQNPMFENCRKVINIKPYLGYCINKYYYCQDTTLKSCVCDVVASFVRNCGLKTGERIPWRTEGFCYKKCHVDRQHYLDCGSKQKVCGQLDAQCQPTDCIQGCVCPSNFVLHNNTCIPEENCPCNIGGRYYLANATVLIDDRTCKCLSGVLKCSDMNINVTPVVVSERKQSPEEFRILDSKSEIIQHAPLEFKVTTDTMRDDHINSQVEMIILYNQTKEMLERAALPTSNLSQENKELLQNFFKELHNLNEEIVCLASLTNKSTCDCKYGKRSCTLHPSTNKLLENNHRIQNNINLVRFIEHEVDSLIFNGTSGSEIFNKTNTTVIDINNTTQTIMQDNGRKNFTRLSFSNIKGHLSHQGKQILNNIKMIKCFTFRTYDTGCQERWGITNTDYKDFKSSGTITDIDLLKLYTKYLRYMKNSIRCMHLTVKSGRCSCSNGVQLCLNYVPIEEQMMTFQIKLAIYYHFIKMVENQLHCLISRSTKNLCTCSPTETCNRKSSPDRLLKLIDGGIPKYKNKEKRFNFFELQLKCLAYVRDKSGTCVCKNGLQQCQTSQEVCSKVSCPPSSTLIQRCKQCCPECVPSSCPVDIGNNTIVFKQPGEEWAPSGCRKCKCLKEQNHLYVNCTEYPCKNLTQNLDTISEEVSCVKGRGCSLGFRYKSASCVENGKFKQVGETWFSDGNCVKNTCKLYLGQLIIIRERQCFNTPLNL